MTGRDNENGLGAAPWAARARAELEAAGGRPHPFPRSAVSLSHEEHRIAQLAADGLTNAEIGEQLCLSPRAVGVHLYRLYPKLGVTTRIALRDALRRMDAPSAAVRLGLSAT